MIFWRASPVAGTAACVLLSILPQQSRATTISSANVAVATPSPLVVPPSQAWDGNDGPWSSFILRVGTPAQALRVLISTTSYQPLVILPQGCSKSDPSNCGSSRGGIFATNASSTWVQTNITKQSIFSLTIDTNLGLAENGYYGFDDVSLGYVGSDTPTLDNQLVGGIASKNFFTGMFGLNPAASNLSSINNPIPSYMTNLKYQNYIPSVTYGYTAGCQYRYTSTGGVLGSLILGGYDKSLFTHNNLTFPFNPLNKVDLTANVNSITYSSGHTNKSLSATPFPAFINSDVPYFYLPLAVCQQFESAFGIVYDNTTGLYLVNDTLHIQLLAQSANVTFELTNAAGESTIDIVLPYQAFDLIAEWPLVKNTTRYFPLKRAVNDTQTTLGRAFLQEAYLIADYGRSNFSVYQRKWEADPVQEIITILPVQTIIEQVPVASNNTNTGSHGVPVGAIAGASAGGVLLITALGACILFLRNRNQKLKKALVSTTIPPVTTSNTSPPSHPFTSLHVAGPLVNTSKPELDATPSSHPTHKPHFFNKIASRMSRQLYELPVAPQPTHEAPTRSTIYFEMPASPVPKAHAANFWAPRQKLVLGMGERQRKRDTGNGLWNEEILRPVPVSRNRNGGLG